MTDIFEEYGFREIQHQPKLNCYTAIKGDRKFQFIPRGDEDRWWWKVVDLSHVEVAQVFPVRQPSITRALVMGIDGADILPPRSCMGASKGKALRNTLKLLSEVEP